MWLRGLSRWAYRRRGLARLAELNRRRWARAPRTVWIDDFDGDLRFRCELHEHMGSQIYWRGSYSWPLLRHLDRRLAPEMVFVDAGANHGEVALFAAKRCTRGEVIAFEPAPAIFSRLRDNFAANPQLRGTLVGIGLADAPGRATLHAPPGSFADGTEHAGLPSLYAVDSSFAPVAEVELDTLDRYLGSHPVERLDWIKLDVEGAELAILRGAHESLASFRPRLLLELNDDTARAAGSSAQALLDWLDAAGYECFELDDAGVARPFDRGRSGRFHNLMCAPAGAGPAAERTR